MAGDSFINRLPLAIGVVAGGVTWLMVIFFLTAGFLGNLQSLKPAELYLSQPTGGSCTVGIKGLVPEFKCGTDCYYRVTYICQDNFKGQIDVNQIRVNGACQKLSYWRKLVEPICAKHPYCPSPRPSVWPAPWPSPVASVLPSASASATPACVKEGETMPIYPGFSCCGSLIAIPTNKPDKDGLCAKEPLLGASICAKCGDADCGLGENFCNCQIDCLQPKASAAP
jgi:hypothetical protein